MTDGKNWNDLPPELKRKCIEEMDFKQRTLLRSTSKGDRVMVDSVKQAVEHLIFNFRPMFTEFWVYSHFPKEKYGQNISFSDDDDDDDSDEEEEDERETDLSLEVEKFDKVLQFFKQILERSEINRFEIRMTCEKKDSQDVKLITKMIESVSNIRATQFEFEWQTDSSIELAILKKCDTKLKDITMKNLHHAGYEKLDEFFNIPSVIGAEKLHLSNYDETEETLKIKIAIVISTMRRWFAKNEPIGKQISIDSVPLSVLENFESKFADRVIRKDEENGAIRFRMDDVDKHLWLRISPRDNYLQCFIVAASAADPDFKKMDKERIIDITDFINWFNNGDMSNELDAIVEALGPVDPAHPGDYVNYYEDFL